MTSQKTNHHKLIVTIKAESNGGTDYSESQRRELKQYLLETTGAYLASQGFKGQVQVDRESILSQIEAKLFG